MKQTCIVLLGALGLGLLAPAVLERTPALPSHFTALANSAATFSPATVFAVDTRNMLRHVDAATPDVTLGTVAITGLQAGEDILGIDFRPATGQLYGLGSTNRVYVIDAVTGAASSVDGPFTPPLNGTDFGFDFNPTVDRIRVVSDAGQNLRLDPDTGTVAGTDLAVNPAGNLVASAYTNNFASATTTVLYGIDSDADALVIQSPPNDGTFAPVGPLGVDITGPTGFDIAAGTGVAYASLTAPAATTSSLYTIDLATGAATLVGAIGGDIIRDIAVRVGAEVIYGVTETSGGAFNLISFNAATPGTILATVPITGIEGTEAILGIDFRPATGQLFAIGSTNQVYVINTSTGAATAVGAPFTPALSGTSFGVDFNPQADRLRVVSDEEQNLRINPNTGAVANNDSALNPAGNVVAAAYSNNFAGTTSTTLYDIDSDEDQLFIQSPPNSGTLVAVGTGLGVDLGPTVGFDIASGSGNAYVSGYLPGATSPSLFTLNLATGTATPVGLINTTDTLIGISVALTSAMAGTDTPGSYVSATGVWFLRNSNTPGPADSTFTFGAGGASFVPIKGDWDGDGDDTVGIYNTVTGAFFLRNSNSNGPADVPAFTFGGGGSNFVPVAGDWDGDGDDTVGIYNSSTGAFFLKNTNTAGTADIVFTFGGGGAIPIAGDWNADNTDTIGLYVQSTGAFFLRNSNTNGPADITFTFGVPGNTPLAGDWNGDGADSVGVYASATAAYFLANGFTGGAADYVFTYGPPGSVGLAGDWAGQ